MSYESKKPRVEEIHAVGGYGYNASLYGDWTFEDTVIIPNLSGTNTGDQVGDGVTITGAGTVGDPFVAVGGGSGTVTSVDITASANITVTGNPITTSGTIDLQMVEVDPVFTASEAFNITGTDITNLSNLSGTNTGDQDLSPYQLISGMATDVPANETDPVFTASDAASITATDITNLANLSGTNTGDQDLTPYFNKSVDTSANITQASDNNFLTDAQLTVVQNTSNTNTGDQNIFQTIAVSGQSDVVADTTTDILTLAAGTGITITTDAGTDTVTITSSVTGDVVGPGSATDNAITRFDSTTGKLVQNSSATVDDSGYLTANGYIWGTGAVNSQTGTTYTIASTDNGRPIEHSNASAITVTITDSGMPADFCCTYMQTGAGQVSFTAGGTAVIRNVNSQTKIAGQWGTVTIKRIGSGTNFVIIGATGP